MSPCWLGPLVPVLVPLIPSGDAQTAWVRRAKSRSTAIGVKKYNGNFLFNACSDSIEQFRVSLQAALVKLLVENGVQSDVSKLHKIGKLIQPKVIQPVLGAVANHEVFQKLLGIGVFFPLLMAVKLPPNRVVQGMAISLANHW